MSKIFHPDRHHDPEKKKQADIFFNKIKNAYESKIYFLQPFVKKNATI